MTEMAPAFRLKGPKLAKVISVPPVQEVAEYLDKTAKILNAWKEEFSLSKILSVRKKATFEEILHITLILIEKIIVAFFQIC